MRGGSGALLEDGGAHKAFLILLCGGVLLRGASAECSTGWFRAPEAPRLATDHNGVALEETCFEGEGPHHVFVIGDWGGVDTPPVPADHRSPEFGGSRPFIVGVDDRAQQRVALQMKKRAATSDPDYVLNVGDNFYWGGLLTDCGKPVEQHVDPWDQWGNTFERIYTGPGLDGKQWLGVLGNHDYGGFHFTGGWDQAIAYTWGGFAASTNRWMTPAQHWSAKVVYPDFTVDYFFVDSNNFNAWEENYDVEHNICGNKHNREGATCGDTGPANIGECEGWFKGLWERQVAWLEDLLSKTDTDWQIVVTHFPATAFGTEDWKRLCDAYGVDLVISGHMHVQQVAGNHDGNPLAPTTHLISGGGGGITSEGEPHPEGLDDMYGFYDLTLTKDVITVEAISHGGQTRSITEVYEWSVAKKKTNKQPPVVPPPEPDGNEFEMAVPDWASGGTAWFSLDGSWDRSCLVRDEPMVLHGASSLESCRAVCESMPACGGMEYSRKKSRCSLWAGDVAETEENQGTVCLSYRKGKVSEQHTLRPTAAPTAAPTTLAPEPEAQEPEAREQDAEDSCNVYMTVHGVNFDLLSQDEVLSSAFEAKVKEALIGVLKKAQSIDVSPEGILLQLRRGGEDSEPDPKMTVGRRLGEPGSILVVATVTPPAGESLAKVVSALGEAVAVSDSVTTAVSAVEGIEAVSSGKISVAEVVAEAGSPVASASSAGGPQPSPQETRAASPVGEGLPTVVLAAVGVVAALVAVVLAVVAARRRPAELPDQASPPKAHHSARRRQDTLTASPTRQRPWALGGRRRSRPGDEDEAAAAAAEAQAPQDAWSTFSSALTGRRTPEPEPPPPPPPSRFGLW